MLEQGRDPRVIALEAAIAAIAFSLASSACYVINDIQDRETDRLHPRKRKRPIAAGHVSVPAAAIYAAALLAASTISILFLPEGRRFPVAACVALYIANVVAYSIYFKHKVIGDVVSLAVGFVLRVMGGCAAVGIFPTTWLLNVAFFLSMFLAFGKRLGERRTLAVAQGDADDATRLTAHRRVQSLYTDVLLQMVVVVTAVGTLMTYAGYVQAADISADFGINLLWFTLLPATYGMLRCIVLLEAGRYDDPTELAYKDRGFIVASIVFGMITVAAFLLRYAGAGNNSALMINPF
jgi:4-hydroxybenzoate polyprenyltransferase